jgi:hypothetical protein
MTLTTSEKIIAGLCAALVAVLVYHFIYAAQQDGKFIRANNELASLMPYKHISDSLGVRVATIGEDLDKSLAKNSQLARTIKEKDQKILALASVNVTARIDSVKIPTYVSAGRTMFDTTNQWFNLQGIIDSASVLMTNIELRDSISVVVTKSVNDIVYGYAQTHNPYIKVTSAEFAIDLSAYIEKPSSFWKWVAIGEGILIVVKLAIEFLK